MPGAVVLLSGGMDSAVAAARATDDGYRIITLAVDYGQLHRAELAAAEHLSRLLNAVEHAVLRVDLRAVGGSALTDDIPVPRDGPTDEIPVTYVPARNTILLSLALGLAEARGAQAIYLGVNAVDYSGYPDCRPAFIDAFQRLAALGTKAGVEGRAPQIRAPLVDLSKADIVAEGVRLKVPFAQTVSCYVATSDGLACGTCDACRLRRQGFEEAGVADPTRYAKP